MRSHRDRGITIVELTVTIALIGVLSTALLAGISVVLRSERPTTTRLAESRDQQQLTNYFTQDVNATPPTGIDVSAAPAAPCGSAGVNRLQLTAADGSRVSYRLDAGVTPNRLVRHRCVGPTGRPTVVAIAKELGPGGVHVAVVPSGGTARVTLTMTKETSGRVVVLSATARNTRTTLPATPPPVAIANPLDVGGITQSFSLLVEEDATVGNTMLGSVAVGGDFAFTTGYAVAGNSSTFVAPGESTPTGLLVGGRVIWPASGSIDVNRGFVHVGDMTGNVVIRDGATGAGCLGPGTPINVQPVGTCNANRLPRIRVQQADQSDQTRHPVGRADLFPFTAAFAGYRATSTALAAVTYQTCPAVMAGQIWDQNNVAYWVTGNATLRLVAGKVNVLSLPTSRINAISSMNPGGTGLGSATALIINVTDSGHVVFKAPSWGAVNGAPTKVLWNFPNATSLTLQGNVDGTIFAPGADVTAATGSVKGAVIARSIVSSTLTVGPDRFAVELSCSR